MAKGKKAKAMNKKVITFEQLNNAFDDAMRIAAKRRTEKQRKTLRINFAQELRKALDEMDKEEFKRTGTCWDCKHYDRKEEKCLIIKRWFGEDIPGGHDSIDFCSKIERRESDENN